MFKTLQTSSSLLHADPCSSLSCPFERPFRSNKKEADAKSPTIVKCNQDDATCSLQIKTAGKMDSKYAPPCKTFNAPSPSPEGKKFFWGEIGSIGSIAIGYQAAPGTPPSTRRGALDCLPDLKVLEVNFAQTETKNCVNDPSVSSGEAVFR